MMYRMHVKQADKTSHSQPPIVNKIKTKPPPITALIERKTSGDREKIQQIGLLTTVNIILLTRPGHLHNIAIVIFPIISMVSLDQGIIPISPAI